jgi:hypothetical protein
LSEYIKQMKISGSGYGLDFEAQFGEIKIVQTGGATRVFVSGDDKGVVVDRGFSMTFPKVNVSARIVAGGELKWDDAPSKAQAALQTLRDVFIRSHRGLIRVNSGGDVKGSDLAGKIKIKLDDGCSITRTVPASQVEALDGKLWIPRWLAIEKADGKAFTGETRLPFVLEGAIARIEAELARQVALLQEQSLPLQEAERINAPIRAQQAIQAKEAAKIQNELEAQASAKRQKKQQIAEAKAQARIASLPIHAQGVTVRGINYETWRGQLIAKEWELENVTVRVSGTRAYVFEDENAVKPLFWKPLEKLSIDHMPIARV